MEVELTACGSARYCGDQLVTVVFFEMIEEYTKKYDPDTDYSLVLDRLFKRYVTYKDAMKLAGLMGRAKHIFGRIPVPKKAEFEKRIKAAARKYGLPVKNLKQLSEPVFNIHGIEVPLLPVDFKGVTLAGFYEKHFEAIDNCIMGFAYYQMYYEELGEKDYMRLPDGTKREATPEDVNRYQFPLRMQHLRIIKGPLVEYYTDKYIPWEEYDALGEEDVPIWLRVRKPEEEPQERKNVSYKDGEEVPYGTPGSVRVKRVITRPKASK
jgi:hypothetical protein